MDMNMNNNEETERCPMCPNHCMKGQTKCERGAAYFSGESGNNSNEESRRNHSYGEHGYDGNGEYSHNGNREYSHDYNGDHGHSGNRHGHGEHGHGESRQHGRGESFHEGHGGRGYGKHSGNTESKENAGGHAGRNTDDGWHHSNEPEDSLYGLMRQSGHYLFHKGQGNAAHGQERILTILAENPEGVSQRMLQNRLGIQSGSMSEILNKLEDKGFVLREKDPEDQRRVTVLLTDEGTSKAGELLKTAGSTDTLFDVLTEEEKTQLKSIMTKLVGSWLAE